MLQDITAEGITTDNVCLYDIAALKFKFNEIEALTRKFMFEWPDDECYEIDDTLRLLRSTVKHCLDQVRMDHSVGLALGHPLAASTPEARNQTSTYHTANQSINSSRKIKPWLGCHLNVYLWSVAGNRSRLPKITFTMTDESNGSAKQGANATYDVSRDDFSFEPNLTYDLPDAGLRGAHRASLYTSEADRRSNASFKEADGPSLGDSRYDDEFSYINALYNAVAAGFQSHSI